MNQPFSLIHTRWINLLCDLQRLFKNLINVNLHADLINLSFAFVFALNVANVHTFRFPSIITAAVSFLLLCVCWCWCDWSVSRVLWSTAALIRNWINTGRTLYICAIPLFGVLWSAFDAVFVRLLAFLVSFCNFHYVLFHSLVTLSTFSSRILLLLARLCN